MAQATETFELGAEQVSVVVEIDLGTSEQIITGDFAGSVPAGTVGRLRGSIRLLADLHVRGTLVADPTGVDLNGQNLYEIHTHDGGVLNLAGLEKSAWVEWGDPVIGWQVGDKLAVAPTVSSIVVASLTWPGSWAGLTRPPASPDVTVQGRVMKPEVVNLSQTLILRNLTRIMHHAPSQPQTLKWLKILDSGVSNALGFYPNHFHLTGDTSVGSLLEGVVVEGGKNHAFVPHGSNGITYKDCVAYKTARHAFWWDTLDSPGYIGGGADLSFDVDWDHCLALVVNANQSFGSGFRLAGGEGNRMVGCRSVLVRFGNDVTGVHWRFDEGVWDFSDYVAHNNGGFGLSVWQNSNNLHPIENVVCYQNVVDIDHGAYGNLYDYKDVWANKFRLHAKSEESPGEALFLTLERANLNVLEVTKHSLGRMRPAKVIDSQIGTVLYTEYEGEPSWMQYRDCGLTPSDFTLTLIRPDSIIEIFESGVLMHRWAGGWS